MGQRETDENINRSLNFPAERSICLPAATAVPSVGYEGSKIAERGGFMIDRKTLRLSAVLLVVGFIFYVLVGLLHPGGPANDHRAVFAVYASSASWTAVHLGQFVGMAVIIAGLLVLYFALDLRAGGAAWVARLGAVSAAVALGLYGVLQAVDGVALKQAVDAWVSAPEAERRPASLALRRFGGWSGAPEVISASCLVSA
jgi:hypothetical protein